MIHFHFLSLLILLIPVLHAVWIRDLEKVCWTFSAHNTSLANVMVLHLFTYLPPPADMFHLFRLLEGITTVIGNAHFPGCDSTCSQCYLRPTSVYYRFALCLLSEALPSSLVCPWLREQKQIEVLWRQGLLLSCKNWNSEDMMLDILREEEGTDRGMTLSTR